MSAYIPLARTKSHSDIWQQGRPEKVFILGEDSSQQRVLAKAEQGENTLLGLCDCKISQRTVHGGCEVNVTREREGKYQTSVVPSILIVHKPVKLLWTLYMSLTPFFLIPFFF